MEKSSHIEDLLRSFDAQKQTYFDSAQKVHELLAQKLASFGSSRFATKDSLDDSTGGDSTPKKDTAGLSPGAPSVFSKGTGEESDEDVGDDQLYAQQTLESESYNHDGLRQHLLDYPWNEYGVEILKDVIHNPEFIRQECLFPTRMGHVDDRSHLSGYQVWDIGTDGAPLSVDCTRMENETSRAMAIWHTIKDINPPSKERKAVGRITIMREPSPVLFGALHYTLNSTFDMDEIFKLLVAGETSSSHVHRAFEHDPRRQCSKVFSFEYFTIIGEDCKPMSWHLASEELDKNPKHILITRCNSVVALALTGEPVRKVRNPSRRARGQNDYGNIYDPFSSWHLLNLQCFPDLKASTDVHDTNKHYTNGPEAFLITLLGEFRDAQRRFEDINRAITKLITPSASFMFDSAMRDDLLFEDEHFTYVRRYFWAYQTLGIMNDSIRSIVDAFEHDFPEELFDGKAKLLWPLDDEHSQRNKFYKKKLLSLQKKFETQMRNFRALIQGNEERRTEIRGLREELYVGTSVKESRKSMEATETTVQQGHNIKLLTLVSIFFLPSQFVTSVFGMTAMPDESSFWLFGVVMVAICVPFFVLIGSMNTNRGMNFWLNKSAALSRKFASLFHFVRHSVKGDSSAEDENKSDENAKPESERPKPPVASRSQRGSIIPIPRRSNRHLSDTNVLDELESLSPRPKKTHSSRLVEMFKRNTDDSHEYKEEV